MHAYAPTYTQTQLKIHEDHEGMDSSFRVAFQGCGGSMDKKKEEATVKLTAEVSK